MDISTAQYWLLQGTILKIVDVIQDVVIMSNFDILLQIGWSGTRRPAPFSLPLINGGTETGDRWLLRPL